MALAALLTVLAFCGVFVGVFLGRAGRFADYLAAAGGGLLSGISLFWLIPEIGETTGRFYGLLMACAVAGLLALLDGLLSHSGHSARHGVVWPLLLATGIHSLLDGWSIRLLGTQPMTDVTVTIGLALHKLPEGAALGWLTRRSLRTARQALLVSCAAEVFTLAGALAEPNLNASGSARFGMSWVAGVLALIAGGFIFLGVHAIIPARKKPKVLATFFATLALVAALAFA